MIPTLLMDAPADTAPAAHETHVLVVARDPAARWAISDLLLDADLRVSQAATFGIVEVLLRAREAFDLLIVVQTADEMPCFGVPQLVRSVDPDMPILVLEGETARSPAVLEMTWAALARWRLREPAARATH